MQVVGIDLAWGAKARTGLALTDANGRLIRSASVITDEHIAEFLHGSAPSVIALDAPIIVTNPAGMRDCERELSRDFRKFHAGTHPTNMNQPSMQPEPRARRLAKHHDWNVDPTAKPCPSSPIALEVYPHSSMVGLFGLDRVLAYKAKSGRTPQHRQEQFLVLASQMERYCDDPLHLTSSDRWLELKETAASATKPSELNSIEDEIDAIFCAYIAWVFATSPTSLILYGSAATGVIVTFPPPAGLS